MTPERWQRIKALYAKALKQPADERAAFLAAACADDPLLLKKVRALLETHGRPSPVDDLAEAWVSPLLRGLREEPAVRTRIGPYEIVGEIGRGGMGVVYRAHDPRLGRDLAIKLLPPSLSAQAEAKARFLTEARAASALDHPNICTIYAADQTEDGQLYMAMALYDGQTLKEKLKAGPLPVEQSIDLALQVAAGLRCAHAAGVVHRDVKPANVIVTVQGLVKLLDFGVARLEHGTDLTKPGTRIGTVAYMAPEQVRGESVDARADLWALGVVLYEMLAGQRPFRRPDEPAVIHAILNVEPEPLTQVRSDVPLALERVVRKALAKSPAHRFEQARALITTLRQVRDGRPVLSGGRTRPLPAPLTSLIGREGEIEQALELLARSRLLTLTGPGGIGKTRLALDVAARAADEYADGVFLVELAPITDPALVAPAIAHVLGVPEAPDHSLMDELKRVLESAHLLLVLDNVEQVVAAASVVAELLATCPALKVLATSRMPIRLSGEQELLVRPLAVPPPAEARERDVLTAAPAVQLFVERARAVRPDFDLTPDNAGAVAALCRRLDGLPLAIELAAARTKVFSPAVILERLADRLDLLGGSARDRPSRHQTLQHAMAWSFDLLDEPAQRAFRHLSVFAGGFTLEAAGSVLEDEAAGLDVVNTVAELLDHSLLQRVNDAPPRFSMLETIRTFALERLHRAGEADEARHRHALFFLHLAEENEPRLTGPDQAAAFDYLEAEHDNLRAALAFAEARANAEIALRLGAALWRFWLVRGYMSEGRPLLRRLLAQPGLDVSPRERARALNGLATIVQNRGDNAEARALLEESLALWRRQGEPSGLATALNNLGWVACEQSDLEAARAFSEEALSVCRALGDRRGIAVALNNLGWVAFYQGDARRACTLHEEGLTLRREIGDRRGVAFASTNLAAARRTRGEYEQARALVRDALYVLQSVPDRILLGWARTNKGEVLYDQGDLDAAADLFEAVIPLWREVGARPGLAQALTNLGSVMLDRGDVQQASPVIEEALGLWKAIGNRWGTAWTLCCRGRLLQTEHKDDAARASFEKSLALQRKIGDRRGQAESLEALAIIDAEHGRSEAALRHFQAAQSLRKAGVVPVPPSRSADVQRLASRLGIFTDPASG